jgi:hypothetical protein
MFVCYVPVGVHNQVNVKAKNTVNTKHLVQGASVNRAILQHSFFWFGNTGADTAIAILLPTLRRFSCNGVVDWSITCFCCESVLQKL